MLIQGVFYGAFQMLSAYGLTLEPIYKNRCCGDKAGGTVAALKGKAGRTWRASDTYLVK